MGSCVRWFGRGVRCRDVAAAIQDVGESNVGQPGTLVRLVNALVALTFASLALAAYWPMTKLVDLHRADLGIRGEWIGGHAKRISKLTPGGVADLAGLHVGDVLEFDPREEDHWILAGYRDVPEGFAARLPVRRANGSRTLVMFKPHRVPFLPGLDDVMATAAQLTTASVVILLGVVLIWARPGLMTWSLFMAYFAAFPYFPWTAYLLAFETGRALEFWSIVASLFLGCLVMVVPFALCFPRSFLHHWPAWKQVTGAMLCVAVIAYVAGNLRVVPFEQDPSSFELWRIALVPGVFVPVLLLASLALVRTYRDADGPTRARLRWLLLGMIAPMVSIGIAIAIGIVPYLVSGTVSGHMLTAPGWVFALGAGVLFPIAVGIAVLRERVVDIQFAVSRTVVYGAVSSLVLVVLAALHWLLGKLIEQTHLAIGIEAIAAVGLGLVLHRATEAINRLADRALFRRRHAAEQHLQRVMSALPFATGLRAIGEALVTEPARELDLVSAAVFYRQSRDGPSPAPDVRQLGGRSLGEPRRGLPARTQSAARARTAAYRPPRPAADRRSARRGAARARGAGRDPARPPRGGAVRVAQRFDAAGPRRSGAPEPDRKGGRGVSPAGPDCDAVAGRRGEAGADRPARGVTGGAAGSGASVRGDTGADLVRWGTPTDSLTARPIPSRPCRRTSQPPSCFLARYMAVSALLISSSPVAPSPG